MPSKANAQRLQQSQAWAKGVYDRAINGIRVEVERVKRQIQQVRRCL